jgi:ubiquinone/menaquinone biosynthesis C-methylase UbiE
MLKVLMMEHLHGDRAKFLMSDERKRFHDPATVLTSLGAKPGMVMADLGSGPGFFAVPMAQLAGDGGIVYAVDGNQAMLNALKENLAKAGVNPKVVTIIESDVCNTKIPDASVDLVLFANLLHEVADRQAFFKELNRIVKPDACIVDLDWKKIPTEQGPPMKERLSEAEASAVFAENGFSVVKKIDVGPCHYELIGRPAGRT